MCQMAVLPDVESDQPRAHAACAGGQPVNPGPPSVDQRLHRGVTLTLQIVLVIGLAFEISHGQWLNVAATAGVLVLTLLPLVLGRAFSVFIPAEFEVLAVVFVFAAVFLGEVQGYYVRFWWWDAVLHTASGFLLGIVGFLLVHVLNEKEDLELHMKISSCT